MLGGRGATEVRKPETPQRCIHGREVQFFRTAACDIERNAARRRNHAIGLKSVPCGGPSLGTCAKIVQKNVTALTYNLRIRIPFYGGRNHQAITQHPPAFDPVRSHRTRSRPFGRNEPSAGSERALSPGRDSGCRYSARHRPGSGRSAEVTRDSRSCGRSRHPVRQLGSVFCARRRFGIGGLTFCVRLRGSGWSGSLNPEPSGPVVHARGRSRGRPTRVV